MDNKERPTEYFPESYRTGDVRPPREHRGLITLLLLLVLFLGSLVSALSFWGIHLTRLLEEKENTSVRFIPDMGLAQADAYANSTQISGLGITGCFLSSFDRHYFDLPQGIYITEAANAPSGIRTGDILVSINGTPITDPGTLHGLLETHAPGAVLSLDIYRDGARQTLTAVLEKTN